MPHFGAYTRLFCSTFVQRNKYKHFLIYTCALRLSGNALQVQKSRPAAPIIKCKYFASQEQIFTPAHGQVKLVLLRNKCQVGRRSGNSAQFEQI